MIHYRRRCTQLVNHQPHLLWPPETKRKKVNKNGSLLITITVKHCKTKILRLWDILNWQRGYYYVCVQTYPYPHRFERNLVFTQSVEILTHSEFQHSAMYGCRARTRRKMDFLEIFSLPVVTKSTITL